jgi:hypothetical protein
MLLSPLEPCLHVRSAALCTIAQMTAAHLIGRLGDRWSHTVGVARCAADVACALSLPGDELVAAAWLHNIGLARAAVVTGLHPLDGARYLAAQLWPMRIAGLVAHHSGARFIATLHGLDPALADYPDEGGRMSDALTYADRTVGPAGQRLDWRDRHAEMIRRHGPDSWNARVDDQRRPYLQAVAERVEHRLANTGTAESTVSGRSSGRDEAPRYPQEVFLSQRAILALGQRGR